MDAEALVNQGRAALGATLRKRGHPGRGQDARSSHLVEGRKIHEPGGGEGEQVRNHGAGGLFVGEGQGEAHCQSVDHASVHEPKGVGLQLHGCDVRPAAKARAAAEQQEDEGDAQREDLPRRPLDVLVAVERALLAEGGKD